MTATIGWSETPHAAQFLPADSPRRSRDLSANWSEEDNAKAIEIRDGARQAQQEQHLLERAIADLKFEAKKAAEAERDALVAECPDLKDADFGPPMNSTFRRCLMRIKNKEKELEDAKRTEAEYWADLRAHFLASTRRAAISVYREEFEQAAQRMRDARLLLLGAQAVLTEAGQPDLVHLPTFSQLNVPCEPLLGAKEREYDRGENNGTVWWIYARTDTSRQAAEVAQKARSDFLRLVGSDVNIRWHR